MLITSYDTLRTDIAKLNKVDWSCAIFDEVHKLKGVKSKTRDACLKLNTLKRFGIVEFYLVMLIVQV